MPTFAHDGIEFHYQENGSGHPFVFQHGLGGDVTQPFGLFQPPAGVRLVAFDTRAHGRTRPPGDPAKLCFRIFGDDLRALLDHLGIARAVIGGISMGAALALHFTLRWPERADALVLSRPAWLEAPCPWNVRMFTAMTRLLEAHGAGEGLRRFQASPDYLETLRQWPDAAKSLALQFQSPGIEETFVKLERIINDRPHPDRRAWAALDLPTLVLANQLDPIHPFAYGQELARVIPGAELREVTSKSVSVTQHGADVQRELTSFLTRHLD